MTWGWHLADITGQTVLACWPRVTAPHLSLGQGVFYSSGFPYTSWNAVLGGPTAVPNAKMNEKLRTVFLMFSQWIPHLKVIWLHSLRRLHIFLRISVTNKIMYRILKFFVLSIRTMVSRFHVNHPKHGVKGLLSPYMQLLGIMFSKCQWGACRSDLTFPRLGHWTLIKY